MFESVQNRYYAKFDISSAHIRQTLAKTAEEHSIRFDEQGLNGYKDTLLGRIAGYRYDLEIKPKEDHYEVEERILVPLRWHLLLLIPSLVLVLASLNLRFRILDQYAYTRAGLTLLSTVSVLIWAVSAVGKVSLLVQSSPESTDRLNEYSVLEVSIHLIGILLVIVCSLILLDADLLLVLAGLLFYLLLCTLHLLSVLTNGILSGVFLSFNIIERLPIFSIKLFFAELLVLAGSLSVIFTSAVLSSSSYSGLRRLLSLVVLSISVMVFVGLVLYVRDQSVPGYQDFLEMKVFETHRFVKYVASTVLISGSYLILITGYHLFLLLLEGGVSPVHRVSVLLMLASVLYFPAGILYQNVRYFWQVRRMFQRSEPVELGFDPEYSVREIRFSDVDSTFYFAATVSTGVSQSIILSEDLVDDFEEGCLRAVVAHEASHIRNNDAGIVSLVVLSSLITFVGQNLLFGMLDFRSREYRADQEAARNVGPDSVIHSLKMFEKNQTHNQVLSGVGVAPFGGKMESPSGFRQYFDLFFGDYTIREAHPSINDRIEKLQNQTN